MAASRPHNKVMVYNTRTNKEYAIHPQMAKDPSWMAARGLILQREVKPFEVTNLEDATAKQTPKATTKSK